MSTAQSLGTVDAGKLQAKSDLVEYGILADLAVGVLEEGCDFAGDAARGNGCGIQPRNAHAARGGLKQAREQLGERGLAGTVLADDAHELAGIEGQVEVVYGGAAIGIGKLNVIEGEHGLGVHGMRAQRRCMRGAGGRLGFAGRVCGVDNARNQALGLIDIQARGTAYQAFGLEAIEDTRDARAVDADGTELVGMPENLVWLALQRDFAMVEHEHAVAVLREQGDLLLNDDDGNSKCAVCLTQRLEDQRGAGGVECRGGLVENQNARTHGEDGGDGYLLLLSAREGGDLAVAQVADADGLERFAHALLDLVVGNAKVLEAKEYLVLDDRGDHLRVDILQHAADDLRYIGERDLAGVVAVHGDGAKKGAGVVVRHGAREAGGKCGLAGTRRTDNADEIALMHIKRHVGERGLGCAAI